MTPGDWGIAWHYGSRFVLSALRAGVRDRYGEADGLFDLTIPGLLAEIAVARVTGLPWNKGGTFGGADVGDDVQVRWTRLPSGMLLAHPDDRDMRLVLVTGQAPRLRIAGWIPGAIACTEKYRAEPRPGRGCYAVPQRDLRPITTLGDGCESTG